MGGLEYLRMYPMKIFQWWDLRVTKFQCKLYWILAPTLAIQHCQCATTPSIYWIINQNFGDIAPASPRQNSCKLFKIIDSKSRLIISGSKSRAEARRDKFSDNGNYSNNCQPSLSFCRYEWSVFVQTNGLFLKKVTQTRSYFIDANRDKHLFVLHTPQSLQASCCLWTYCSMLQWKFSITDKRSLGKLSSVCIHGQNFYFLFLFDLA